MSYEYTVAHNAVSSDDTFEFSLADDTTANLVQGFRQRGPHLARSTLFFSAFGLNAVACSSFNMRPAQPWAPNTLLVRINQLNVFQL